MACLQQFLFPKILFFQLLSWLFLQSYKGAQGVNFEVQIDWFGWELVILAPTKFGLFLSNIQKLLLEVLSVLTKKDQFLGNSEFLIWARIVNYSPIMMLGTSKKPHWTSLQVYKKKKSRKQKIKFLSPKNRPTPKLLQFRGGGPNPKCPFWRVLSPTE